MTDNERTHKLYRLNGQLESILRRLGPCIGQVQALTAEKDNYPRQISRVYHDLRRIQNAIFRQYLS